MTDPPSGPRGTPSWSRDLARRAAAAAASHAGLRGVPSLVSFSTHAVFRLGDRAVRVHRPDLTDERLAAHEVALAERLERAGVPTARPAHPVPVVVGGVSCTIWRWEGPGRRRVSPREHGALLRRLHELPVEAFADDVPVWTPFERTRRLLLRVHRHPLVGVQGRLTLARHLAGVEARALAAADLGAPVVLHCDAGRQNVLGTARGPVLIDLECVRLGPRGFDVVAAARSHGRAHRRFLDGYGVAPPQDGTFDAVLDVAGLVWLIDRDLNGHEAARWPPIAAGLAALARPA